jgi:hypothetical protein
MKISTSFLFHCPFSATFVGVALVISTIQDREAPTKFSKHYGMNPQLHHNLALLKEHVPENRMSFRRRGDPFLTLPASTDSLH